MRQADHRRAAGAVRDNGASRPTCDFKVVTKRQPTEQELADCLFAWTVAKHVKSNAIVYAKDGAPPGIGAGQMNRRDSRAHRRDEGAEAAENMAGPSRAPSVQRSRLRRVLPLRRWPAGGGRSGGDRGDPAGRIDAATTK
jgi:hypothetical protein